MISWILNFKDWFENRRTVDSSKAATMPDEVLL